MQLLQTRQKTNPKRRTRTDGSKPRLVHGVRPRYGTVYCPVELMNPIIFEGEFTDITCKACRRIAGKKINAKYANL